MQSPENRLGFDFPQSMCNQIVTHFKLSVNVFVINFVDIAANHTLPEHGAKGPPKGSWADFGLIAYLWS